MHSRVRGTFQKRFAGSMTRSNRTRPTNRWTGTAIARFASCLFRRNWNEFAPLGHLNRWGYLNRSKKTMLKENLFIRKGACLRERSRKEKDYEEILFGGGAHKAHSSVAFSHGTFT